MALQHVTDASQLASIYKELREESPAKREASLGLLRTWLKTQPHLPQAIDERVMLSFLRGCKHDLARCKRKLDSYFTAHSAIPELFSERDPFGEEIQNVFRTVYMLPMERLTTAGERVTFNKVRDCDPTLFTARGCFRYALMVGDIRLQEERAISGDIYLYDMEGFSLAHFFRLFSPLLRHTLECAQNAYPQRVKQVHLFNVTNFVDKLLAAVRALMQEKMRHRFIVHVGHESLRDHLPLDCLPDEYGGSAGSLEQIREGWRTKIESYREWFLAQEKVKVNETKRPASEDLSTNSPDQLFGWQGSFRKLADID